MVFEIGAGGGRLRDVRAIYSVSRRRDFMRGDNLILFAIAIGDALCYNHGK